MIGARSALTGQYSICSTAATTVIPDLVSTRIHALPRHKVHPCTESGTHLLGSTRLWVGCLLGAALWVSSLWGTLQGHPWLARSRTSCPLTSPEGRHPHPGSTLCKSSKLVASIC